MTTDTQATSNSWRNANVRDLLREKGLTRGKTAQLAGRVNPRLLELARQRAGGVTDSQLIELALGNLVMEDGFAEAFKASRGTISPDVDLEA